MHSVKSMAPLWSDMVGVTMYNCDKISDMVGTNIINVENYQNAELIFHAEDGRKFVFYHEQDCCERVWIEDIVGDLTDLIGVISEAEEISKNKVVDEDDYGSTTWTFYRFSAAGKGTVTVRWCGTSNGYYSERVYFKIEYPADHQTDEENA